MASTDERVNWLEIRLCTVQLGWAEGLCSQCIIMSAFLTGGRTAFPRRLLELFWRVVDFGGH